MRLLDAFAIFNQPRSQEGQKNEAADKAAQAAAPQGEPGKKILNDDDVTLSNGEPRSEKAPRLSLAEYKHRVAEDRVFVKETLRHKLSECGLNPNTRLSVGKNTLGKLEIQAHMPADTRERIEQDLNNNHAFRAAFNRLSVNQPTLDYVSNVMKLSDAYGTNNDLFNSLVSENERFNGLQDIAHRYEAMRSNIEAPASGERSDFRLDLSA
ncbi:hypothetical protein QQM79_13075 [Marinobacteraceae bacterium S3BR75-40.1]